MSTNTDNKVEETNVDKQMKALKAKADLFGIKYSPNIGMDKLQIKIELFMEEQESKTVVNVNTIGPDNAISKAESKAKKPILAIVRDLDPTQQDDPTILMTVGNRHFKVGCIVQKDKEQLIPNAVIKALESKTMVRWESQRDAMTKRPTGNKVAKTTKRYSVQILDANPLV